MAATPRPRPRRCARRRRSTRPSIPVALFDDAAKVRILETVERFARAADPA
jgi:hypothetical protein